MSRKTTVNRAARTGAKVFQMLKGLSEKPRAIMKVVGSGQITEDTDFLGIFKGLLKTLTLVGYAKLRVNI